MLRGALKTGWMAFVFITGPVHAQKWSFAVISDPRGMRCSYRKALREIRDMTVQSTPEVPAAEFVVVNGDIGGIRSHLRIFRHIFRNHPVMKSIYPVIGNHESPWQRNIIIQKILPVLDSITVIDPQAAHYCLDWKNARFLIFNQYTIEAPRGCLGSKAIRWATERIEEARADTWLHHVFIFIHEPAFPRYRHLDDSFNQCPQERNSFWNVMAGNRDLVRAVFCGHTHTCSRIRIADPESADANDPTLFPLQHDGVYQIDSGASGQGKMITVIRIAINDSTVSGYAVEAEKSRGSKFKLIDEWILAAESN